MIAMGTLSHNPAKSTTGAGRFRTGMRSLARGGVRCGALLALVLLLAGAAGCSSARKRDSPSSIFGNLRYRDSQTEARFASTYRTGSLYQDYRTVLIVDAIAMDQEYRRGYVAMLAKRFMLSDADSDGMRRAEELDYAGTISFLVFVYGGNNRPIPLGEPTAQWKVLLQDDDGQTLTPLSIERLRPENPNYQYLSLYFYGLDRWSQAFKVSFPKLDKATLRQPLGSHPVELIVTGLAGTVHLGWQDPRGFYQAPAAQAAAVQAESKPQAGK